MITFPSGGRRIGDPSSRATKPTPSAYECLNRLRTIAAAESQAKSFPVINYQATSFLLGLLISPGCREAMYNIKIAIVAKSSVRCRCQYSM